MSKFSNSYNIIRAKKKFAPNKAAIINKIIWLITNQLKREICIIDYKKWTENIVGLVNKETNKSVPKFIAAIENKSKREDSKKLLKMMQEVTGFKPKVWGDNYFIAFGKYTYQIKNSKEEYEWFYDGFAPRKAKLTLYLNYDVSKEKNPPQKIREM